MRAACTSARRAVSGRNRVWFEAHLFADFKLRPVTWGEGADLIVQNPKRVRMSDVHHLAVKGRVRVERMRDGVRCRPFDDVWFIVVPAPEPRKKGCLASLAGNANSHDYPTRRRNHAWDGPASIGSHSAASGSSGEASPKSRMSRCRRVSCTNCWSIGITSKVLPSWTSCTLIAGRRII